MRLALVTLLTVIFVERDSHASHIGFTPLDIDNHPCKAENLKLTNRYICNSDGHVFCQTGWKEPEDLKLRDPLHPCPLPICEDGRGETCQNGECKAPDFCACEVGWEGSLCEICIPMPGCQHGNCTQALECLCYDGWSGGLCEIPVCEPHNCNGHGTCTGPDQCACYSGWRGETCDECEKLPGCSDHGQCTDHPNTCECIEPDKWGGHLCDEPVCDLPCGEHGTCTEHTNGNFCLCETGWQGTQCDECVPYWNCPETILACNEPNECICQPDTKAADTTGMCGLNVPESP